MSTSPDFRFFFLILEANGLDYEKANKIWDNMSGEQKQLIADQFEQRKIELDQILNKKG